MEHQQESQQSQVRPFYDQSLYYHFLKEPRKTTSRFTPELPQNNEQFPQGNNNNDNKIQEEIEETQQKRDFGKFLQYNPIYSISFKEQSKSFLERVINTETKDKLQRIRERFGDKWINSQEIKRVIHLILL